MNQINRVLLLVAILISLTGHHLNQHLAISVSDTRGSLALD